MPRILGLDLGTNSIGWAILDHERRFTPDNKPLENFNLVFDEKSHPLHGVLIFSEGVKSEKGKEFSKAAERTSFRSARKIKFRRKLRKYETLKVLQAHQFCPIDATELHRWKKYKDPATGKTQNFRHYPQGKEFLDWLATDNQPDADERKKQYKNPYALRDLISKQKLDFGKQDERYKFGRAIYHLAQRRGFLSNADDTSELSIVEEKQPIIESLIQDAPTLADFIRDFSLYLEDFDSKDEREKGLYGLKRAFDRIIKDNAGVSYESVKDKLLERLNRVDDPGKVKKGIQELTEAIEQAGCLTMGQYFYQLYRDGEEIRRRYTGREEHYLAEFRHICEVQQLPVELQNKLERALFYQRPLRSQKGLVGRCTLEPSKPRCPVSHPDYEEYRMWQQINQIKYQNEAGKWEPLLEAERQKIKPKFLRKSKPTFEFGELLDLLGPNRNYNYKPRQTMTGCPTTAALVGLFGADWKQGIADKCNPTFKLKKKTGTTKSLDELANDVWHVRFNFDKEAMRLGFAKDKLDLNDKQAADFNKIPIKKEYASLSRNAICKILPHLRDGLQVSHAIFCANLPAVVDPAIWADAENRQAIIWGINDVIKEYKAYKDKLQIVNGLLKDKRDENAKYSELALPIYEQEILERLQAYYGKNTWAMMENRDELLKEISDKFYTQFSEKFGQGEFLPIERLDQRIKSFLTDNEFCTNESLLSKLYHPADVEKFKPAKKYKETDPDLLGSPMTNSVRNPMAMRSLHQLRQLVNSLIKMDVIDADTRIRVELSRNLNDANKRKAIQRWQKKREDENKAYAEEIKKLYQEETGKIPLNISTDEIIKYRFWLEQGKKCLYTGFCIGISQFIGGNPAYDIEHTIPRSLCNDNSLMNKTLCEVKFNREVKKNSMPSQLANHDEIMERIELLGWPKKVAELDWRIEKLKRATKAATTKEDKDKKIQERHYLTLERNYWKGKLERFTMTEIKAGFKNSQLVDTGIITKYARAFLTTRFKRVESVKGELTAAFREAWGLQQAYEEKDRTNHIHHLLDAITIACMTKEKYDLLARAWKEEEQAADSPQQEHYFKQRAKKIMEASKPWPTYVEDLKKLDESVLIAHHTPDQLPKTTKKKKRVRGKLVKDESGRHQIQQGDSVRGSLHQDTVYGAILKPIKTPQNQFSFDEKRHIVVEQDSDGQPKKFFVVSKELIKNFKEGDLEYIVDEVVKQKVKDAIRQGIFTLTPVGNDNKLKDGERIWMNREKGIEIKKVRVYAKVGGGLMKKAIELKPHIDSSKHPHKRNKYVRDDEMYALAMYQQMDAKGKVRRSGELISLFQAGKYYTASNKGHRNQYPLAPESDLAKGYPMYATLRKGTMVLFYQESKDELKQLSQKDLAKRLFKITGFEERPRIMLRRHNVAKKDGDIKKESTMNFDNPPEGLRVGLSNLDIAVEGIHFWMDKTGHIKFDNPNPKSF
ncbi:MAG: type II CRISPR RNA-guided endonuclease Cas9 [Bacteroidetes bacterium]|nr:type II CRISPR RNA-guided endonuclease Cas9 [Bacteroidota bacterium]